jgi:hypothetical protein
MIMSGGSLPQNSSAGSPTSDSLFKLEDPGGNAFIGSEVKDKNPFEINGSTFRCSFSAVNMEQITEDDPKPQVNELLQANE